MGKFCGKKLICLVMALGLFLTLSGSAAAEQEIFFTIMHTNDEHSSLAPRGPAVDYHPELPDPTVGGIARLATAVEQIREQKEARGEPVLLFSGGDFLGGAPYAWLLLEGFSAELDLMLEMGYDAVVIGNHEFDYGPELLASYLKKAGFPAAGDKMGLLASNIQVPSEHPLEEVGLEENRIIELENGLKIGLMGLIGKDAVSVATNTGDLEFAEQHETARRIVGELQEAGADIIINISHSGVGEEKDLAADVPGIDVIVGGHCHTALHEPEREGETIIVQAGSLLSYLGVLELAYNPEEETLRIRNEETGQPFLVRIDDELDPHPEIGAAMEEYTAELNSLVERVTEGQFDDIFATIAFSDFPIPRDPGMEETPFGNFLTDAMRLMAEEATGKRVDFAFQANGNIRGGVIPGDTRRTRGQISFYDLAKLSSLGMGPDMGPGYPLVSIYLTGEEVRRVFEISAFLSQYMGNTYFLQTSGARYEYVPNRALLFTIPMIDMPVPTTRAVVSAERYTGPGRQNNRDQDYEPLERGDETLYHVVTDLYLLTFLPMVGDLLPQMELIIKDEDGEPVADLEETIIDTGNGELKAWQALVQYAASFPANETGFSSIPTYYSSTGGRIVEVFRPPLWIYPLLFVGLLIFLWYRLRVRKRRREEEIDWRARI